MAPPQGQQMRPSRYLAVLAAIFVILASLVFFAGDGSVSERLKPRLGLDLVGGTTVTLTAANLEGGGAPNANQMEEARRIIESRVNGLGVAEAEVIVEGDSHIVISIPGENRDDVKQVGTPAQLRFRKVLNVAADTSASLDATASATPSASATPQASGSASASATPEPSPSASASPTAAAATPSPTETLTGTLAERRAAVVKKLGDAYKAAEGITSPDQAASEEMKATLKPFTTLSADEAGALPAEMQFNLPQISCAQLNNRTPGSIDKADENAVACDEVGGYKYYLDVAKVLGTDVSDASANINPQDGKWQVDLKFKGEGQNKWTDLTKEAYNNTDAKCAQGSLDGNGRCAVAVVLDNKVVSAPAIQAVIPGDATISGGSINRDGARLLANQLRYGALPLTFKPSEATTITATLGAEYLRAGLLAMGIGMALVIIYAFFYYRLLGSVIFLSLVLSAALTYGALILLGRSIGFTVTLAGIAGFIVSLGVAADSFVIYFERLKDEIREGRSPRSAVGRAWIRARRTIITANMVTILAAVTLYTFGVGSVKGFAFALGVATALDLLIVFLFRHPIMTMLARTPAFLSPRVSGLGRVLHHADQPPATPTTRVKEA